mmetsp:Transcript_4880/g.7836  ORF Transcript_4880/g.7836 Transcript_4880/m.7836 type:complete len:253 (-) Transcript_4880:540-1298(-)
MKLGQLVFGPAGSGKTTYCWEIYKNAKGIGKKIKIVNLDPSTKKIFPKNCIDIRELINSSEVMNELSLGPNGSLIFCIEYLMDNLFWLKERIYSGNYDLFIFDIPGQIELFSHRHIVRDFVFFLESGCDLIVSGLYFIDCHFISDSSKFVAISLCGLSLIVSIEVPNYNVISKIDLVENLPKFIIDRYTGSYIKEIEKDLRLIRNPNFRSINLSLLNLLEDFGMISYHPLDITNSKNFLDFFSQTIGPIFEN